MAVLKVIEVLSNSDKSQEDATQQAVSHAAKTVRNIRGVNVDNMSAVCDENGKITEFRVNVKLTFEVK